MTPTPPPPVDELLVDIYRAIGRETLNLPLKASTVTINTLSHCADAISTLQADLAAVREALAGAQQYAADVLADLSNAKREIGHLRDAVVTYGDRQRMATVHDMAIQQAIDRAFDRDN